MTPNAFISLTPDQEAHLDAWSIVYVEANISQVLGIPLSRFLKDPGEYLLLAWVTAPSKTVPLSQPE